MADDHPYMPFWTDKYLGATTHLNATEHGAYLLLLIVMWRQGGSLPNDDELLRKYARLTQRQWKKVKPVIWPFFNVSETSLCQSRLQRVFNEVTNRREVNSANAKSRWQKTQRKDNATASKSDMQSDMQSQSEMDIYQSQSQIQKEKQQQQRARAREALDFAMEGAGINPDFPPEFWTGEPALKHAEKWLDLGLTPDDIQTAANESRSRHAAPPDGPLGLDAVMERYAIRIGKAKRPNGAAPRQKVDQEKRLKLLADWVNGPKDCPSSLLRNTDIDSLLTKKLVTVEQLKAKGFKP